MKKITYSKERGCLVFYIDGYQSCWLKNRTQTEDETNALIRAYTFGLRWNRNDEFDPLVEERLCHIEEK
jgi:uncharacterized protein